MNHWHSLKELFVCTAVIISLGMVLGIMMIHDQHDDNMNDRIYHVSYDASGVTLKSKSFSPDIR